MNERVRIAVRGVVQGVGFRPFVYGLADALGVSGFVANRSGDVEIEIEGDGEALRAFIDRLERDRPRAARIDAIVTTPTLALGETSFRISDSTAGEQAAAIAPDLALCDACAAEIADPRERRFGYAFTSCAGCGPRLTIVTSAPYDRERTTMARFPMCDACRAEFEDPRDRRFHAQPIACPACGPALSEEIAGVAAAIAAGEIVAIKGLGGYHLACDATNERAVGELRRRKERDAKPFAVMVANVTAARVLAEVSDAEAALLASAERPIVLLRSRGQLPDAIAPGLADLGLMLPYTPLHALLVGDRPLVMTSGNVSDEPIAYRDDDARARLAPIADRIVTHDREIFMRCEDSVARIVDGGPLLLRRARGYAPAPIRLPIPLAEPVLALGGHLKSAFALGVGDTAFVSPHFGDLDHLAAYEAFVAGVAHFEALHRVVPRVIVHDLHPDYATTRLAEELARSRGLPRRAVQHHRAHFASALAELGITRRAIGVIYDGAGYGDDGAIWGGELLVGDLNGIDRAMHLRYVPQPGGDRAAQEPWRMAVAHLRAAGESYDRFERGPAIAAICDRAPLTSSMGRLFDAVAAIGDGPNYHNLRSPSARNHSGQKGGPNYLASEPMGFEGQAAMQLEALARGEPDRGAYPYALTDDELDPRPMIRAIAHDTSPPAVIARRFHSTIVEMTVEACNRLAIANAIDDIVLAGGVFQNAILATEIPARLRAIGLRAHLPRKLPPNDGGLALGQLALVACAMQKQVH